MYYKTFQKKNISKKNKRKPKKIQNLNTLKPKEQQAIEQYQTKIIIQYNWESRVARELQMKLGFFSFIDNFYEIRVLLVMQMKKPHSRTTINILVGAITKEIRRKKEIKSSKREMRL